MRAEIILYDGFDDLDAFAPNEVLRRAVAAGADLAVDYVTAVDGSETVTSAYGVTLRTPLRLGQPDLLLVPGGGWVARTTHGARAEAERGTIPTAIAAAHARGAVVATICTGAMLASAADVMRGRHATTHHGALGDLRAAGAVVIAARVVDDGDIISAGGVTSGLDLTLWLVERFFGAAMAVAIEGQIEYERRGTVWRR
ncbi:MAG TPA: DJ-1/PfpI family protein [Ktedonobacterales bacterium]|jgi:transcriptional regulator GlxA family with amidase domain|nr:DJ-1/PfpI family protein [Ktedonobacterales bacterium]